MLINTKVGYYMYMNFEERKPKFKRAVANWKSGKIHTLGEALLNEGIDPKSVLDYEEDYLQKLIDE